jgi:amino acid transporter
LLTGSAGGMFITLIGVIFLMTLFGNMVSWSYGVNYVAMYAARNNSLPQIFAKESEKTGMPTGAAIMNGTVASILIVIAPFLPSQDLFWSFFALNIVTLLMSYVMVFPAFLKLRSIDPDRNRPFFVSGGQGRLKIMAYLPMILLIIAILFSCVPFNLSPEELAAKVPLTIGVVFAIVIGEIIAAVEQRKGVS